MEHRPPMRYGSGVAVTRRWTPPAWATRQRLPARLALLGYGAFVVKVLPSLHGVRPRATCSSWSCSAAASQSRSRASAACADSPSGSSPTGRVRRLRSCWKHLLWL